MSNRFGAVLFCGFFFLGGCLFVILGLVTLVDCRIAKSTWSVAPGHVIRYDITSNSDGQGGKTWPAYKMAVHYSYQVRGQTYDSDKFGVGASEGLTCNRPDGSDSDFASRHPARSPIDVYYNPRDPSQSALDLDTSVSTTVGSLVGVAPIAIAVFLAWVLRQRPAGCSGFLIGFGAVAYGALVLIMHLIVGAPAGSYYVILVYFLIVGAIWLAASRGWLIRLAGRSPRVTTKF